MEGSRAKGRGGLENVFEFYALRATVSSLRVWRVRRCGGRRYAPTSITVLTALTIHLFKVENISIVFLRISHHISCPKRPLCQLAFFSAIWKFFSSC